MSSLKEFRDQITFFKKLVAEETDESKKQAYNVNLEKAIEQNLNFASLTLKNETKKTEHVNDAQNITLGGANDKNYERGVKAISLALKDLPTYNGLNISETERYTSKLKQYFSLLVLEVNGN